MASPEQVLDGQATSFLKLLARPHMGGNTSAVARRVVLFPSSSGRPSDEMGETVYGIRCWNLSLHEWLLTALGDDYLSGKGGSFGSPFLKSVFVARGFTGSNFYQGGSGHS